MRALLIAAALIVAGAQLAAGAAAAAAVDNGDWIARAKRVSGDVVVEVAGKSQPLAVGDRLPANAVIVTGPASGAGLTFKDNTRVSIGPNSRLELAAYAFEPGQHETTPKLETKLSQGMAAFVSGRVTKQQPGAMQVRTPAALLGVRGTTFLAITGTPMDQ